MATKTKTAAKTATLEVAPVRVKGTTDTVTAKSASLLLYKASDIKAIDTATADKNILAIRATGTKLRRLAHLTACGILLHWQEHGDWTKLTSLADAIGDTMSKRMRTGFFEWIEAFSSLKYNKDTGKFTNVSKDQKMFNLTGIEDAPEDTVARKGALNQPFYDGSFGDRPLHSFDFEAALKTLLERAEREMKRKLETTDKREAKRIAIEPEQVARLEKFAGQFGIKLEEKAA